LGENRLKFQRFKKDYLVYNEKYANDNNFKNIVCIRIALKVFVEHYTRIII